jgi:hypothetical protein
MIFITPDTGSLWPVADNGLKSMGISGKLQIQGSIKKVQVKRFWKDLPEHGALAGSARSEQKERAFGTGQ